jgi:hypothetical protein
VNVLEQDAQVTASVPREYELRGSAREWERDQPAGWGKPLAAVAGPDATPGLLFYDLRRCLRSIERFTERAPR